MAGPERFFQEWFVTEEGGSVRNLVRPIASGGMPFASSQTMKRLSFISVSSRPRKSLKRLLLLIIAVLQRIRVCKILTAIATKTCVFQQRCRLPISCLHAP